MSLRDVRALCAGVFWNAVYAKKRSERGGLSNQCLVPSSATSLVIQYFKMKIIFLVAILGICISSVTKACDCDGERQSIENLLKSSSLTFIGTVVSVKKSSLRDTAIGNYFYKVVFRVDSIVAGAGTGKEISIYVETSNCAPQFLKARQFLIYAFENQYKVLEAHQCHSPCPEINTEMARKDLEAIRQLRNLKSVSGKASKKDLGQDTP